MNNILAEMAVKPSIRESEEIRTRVNFIKNTLVSSGKTALVLGISGGVDSTVCGDLCQQAVDELGPDYKFVSVRLPYDVQADEDDAQRALDFIGPSVQLTVNIQDGVVGIHTEVMEALHGNGFTPLSGTKVDFTKGNVKARMRMIAQYEVAGLLDGLVVGTDHSAENLMGFYTKFGDGACDLAPLFGLNKRQVRSIGLYQGAPEDLINKKPTADLEELNPQLGDEESLGVTYDEIDDFLEGKDVSPEAYGIIIAQYDRTRHKRSSIPTPVG